MAKFLFILAALLCSLTAHAFAPSVMYGYGTSGTYGFHSTMPAACSAAVVALPPYNYSYTHFEGNKCFYAGYFGSQSLQATLKMTAVLRCPEHSSLVGGDCVCTSPATQQGNQCVPPDPGDTRCQQGAAEVSTLNVTLGWARSPLPNKQDQIGKVRNPSNVCAPGQTEGSSCRFKVLDNSNQFRSQTPSSQGLYRISGDFTVIQTDQPCGPDDDAESANPDTPDKACPGSVGELNGKPICVIDPGTSGIDPIGKPGVGNLTDDKGNPSAGKKPSSGEGSGEGGVGRTPTAGSGGNAGGPASAANGGTGTKPGTSGPDGTTNKPGEGKEQAACGAPGQPKCRIDESGTPSGQGDFDAANRGADETREGWLAEIAKAKELKSDGWTWTFQLPSGCTPLELPAYNISLDVCRFQPVIHDIMSMVWLICTVMGCVWMVFNAQKN